MAFSVEMFFDGRGAKEVRAAWDALGQVAGSDYMRRNGVLPHVALAVVQEIGLADRLTDRLRALACQTEQAGLVRSGIGHFAAGPPVVYLAFEQTGWLERLHCEVQSILTALRLSNHEYYVRPRWTPHCTLAMDFPPTRLPDVLVAAGDLVWSPVFTIARIGLVRYPPTELIWSALLAGTT